MVPLIDQPLNGQLRRPFLLGCHPTFIDRHSLYGEVSCSDQRRHPVSQLRHEGRHALLETSRPARSGARATRCDCKSVQVEQIGQPRAIHSQSTTAHEFQRATVACRSGDEATNT